MKSFSQLLENLLFTPSRLRKIALLRNYFRTTPDPDRGYALAALAGELDFRYLKSSVFKQVLLSRVDPVLFELSYDYVGDLAETVSLMWEAPLGQQGENSAPSLSSWIEKMQQAPKAELPAIVTHDFDCATATQRWAMMKLATGGLRVGVSARLARTALAEYGEKALGEVEALWHGLAPPYLDLFEWLEGRAPKPVIEPHQTFHPMMLSHPIDEEKDFALQLAHNFVAEWKWDGIRVQLGFSPGHQHLYTRTGDDISHTFPDVFEGLAGEAVLDGELLVGAEGVALPFGDLQQRLNRKTVLKKHLSMLPAFLRVYDVLFLGGEDLRGLPWHERRARLEGWFAKHKKEEGIASRLHLSEVLSFQNWEELAAHRQAGVEEAGHEGVMLKRRDSPYLAGRVKGYWYKWKRDPRVVDAIMMYAQRGHGRRSSFYSDFTFGVWKDKEQQELVPIGKAYSGFTDEEMKELDGWVLKNTVKKFGPVCEVKKEIVFEVAFDSAHRSARHKSGIALRFPRISRIRRDKPLHEVLDIAAVRAEELGEEA